MQIIEKSWNEFWAKYWRIDNRHNIPGIFEWDRQLVGFIEHVCGLTPPARILDLGCGGGDQAKLFAKKGYEVVGIDIAPSLIEYAQEQFKEENLSGEFIAGDMREINFKAEFNACLILSGTFGFFGDEENQKLLDSIAAALKPGGMLFIMFLSVHHETKPERDWSESDEGWALTESWVDTETSTYRSRIFVIQRDGTILKPSEERGYHANEVIRCYSVPELQGMLGMAGFKYSGSYSNRDFSVPPGKLSRGEIRNIIVAEKKC